MLKIEAPRAILGYTEAEHKPIAKLDIQVSDATELPELGGEAECYIVAAGSTAQIVQTGEWATLDDDGSWYDKDGNEVS